MVDSLTVDEKIGQLVMVSFIGTDVGQDSTIGSLIRDYKVGSVLISSSNQNIPNYLATAPEPNNPNTPRLVAETTNELQRRAYEGSRPAGGDGEYFLPLLVAVDHEGDDFPLTHLRNRFTPVPSAMAIGATWNPEQAEKVGRIVGQELAAVGVNLLLGPVLDVLDNPRSGGSGDMGPRVFGGSPYWVGSMGRAYIRGVHEGSGGRVATVAKHFPGHGDSDRAVDAEVATVSTLLEELQETDLAPFAAVTRQDPGDPLGTTDAMMTSHLHYPIIQGSTPGRRMPVSVDARALNKFLSLPELQSWRNEHLMVADSLGVGAVKRYYFDLLDTSEQFPHRRVAREALMAGNDLLPLLEYSVQRGWETHQLPNIKDTIEYLQAEYERDPGLRSRVDEAIINVLRLKLKLYPELSLDQALVDLQDVGVNVGQRGAAEAIDTIARKALTLVGPSTVGFEAPLPSERILFVECWEAGQCFWFHAHPVTGSLRRLALELYGPEGSNQIRDDNVDGISFGELAALLHGELASADEERIRRLIEQADWLVFALPDYNPEKFPDSRALKEFLSSPEFDSSKKNVIVISYTGPYHLDSTELSKLTAHFALYSRILPFREVSLRALFGEVEPKGKPPVDVSGAGYFLSERLVPDPDQDIPLQIEG
ncbi:MAG: glycoside hydrolase family 3 protein, partial [Dehalococcoidia bacterium]